MFVLEIKNLFWLPTLDTFRTFLSGTTGNLDRVEQIQLFLNQPLNSTDPALVPSAHPAGTRFELPHNPIAPSLSSRRVTGNPGMSPQINRT
jgi:hypothetical protein